MKNKNSESTHQKGKLNVLRDISEIFNFKLYFNTFNFTFLI